MALFFAGAGVLGAVLYAMGWLYEAGFLRYFGVHSTLSTPSPGEAILQGTLTIATPAFAATFVAVVAQLPHSQRLDRARARLDDLTKRRQHIAERLEDLAVRTKSLRGTSEEETNAIWEKIRDVNNEQQSLESDLGTLDREIDQLEPRWVMWILDRGLGKMSRITAIGAAPILICLIYVLPLYGITLASDGAESARIMALVGAMSFLIVSATISLAEAVARSRGGFGTLLLAIVVIIGLPVSAWVNGRLSAYSQWHSNDRSSNFPLITLYSSTQLGSDWTSEAGLFSSPQLFLIRADTSQYIVVPNDGSRHVSLIDKDSIELLKFSEEIIPAFR